MTPREALRFIERRGAEGEVYRLRQRHFSVEVRRGRVELAEAGAEEGFGVRVLLGRRMGFAYGNVLSEQLLERALSVARVSPPDEHQGFAGAESYPSVEGLFDPRVEALALEEVEQRVEELLAPARDRGVEVSQASISWEVSEESICNSFGVEAEQRGSAVHAHLSAVARRGGEVATGMHFSAGRSLDLNFEEVGEVASTLARRSLGAKRLETGDYPLVLRPVAMAELLESALIPAFSADNVQRGRSRLAGRLGERVFGEELTIIDDATLAAGLESTRFDGEGTAGRRKLLVERGELRGYLYDVYTARKAGTESTGNALRNGFSSLPRIDATNFIIRGRGTLEEDALVVHGLIGAHTSNPVTGDFSVETRNAFYDGSPVRKAIIAGNIYELLESIAGFGRDVAQVYGVVTPSVGFSKVRVVG
ncbi:MAG: TldD/PmbA family protein [Euryarchaeota archaeon]|nr:TldD/PmbA family protein [Euryarchaeota archaeon]